MSEFFKSDTFWKVLPVLTGVAGFLLKWVIERWSKENDQVIETRRAIERKHAGLLGPYLLDSARTQNDVNKIRRDWDAAVTDYAVTVNGTLFDISSEVNRYLDAVLDFLRGNIDRSDLEGRRDLANKITIPKIPLIRQRRS